MKKRTSLAAIIGYTLVLMALFWAAQEFDSRLFGGLAVAVLGLGGMWIGIGIVRKREDVVTDNPDEGASDFISTRRGFPAVLSGIGLLLLGLIAVIVGAAVVTGTVKPLFGYIKEHGWAFVGIGGMWLAALGWFKMLGDEESKGAFDRNWIIRQFDRIVGVPILVIGLCIAAAGFTGYVPLLGWVR